jgi:hypothetical protein
MTNKSKIKVLFVYCLRVICCLCRCFKHCLLSRLIFCRKTTKQSGNSSKSIKICLFEAYLLYKMKYINYCTVSTKRQAKYGSFFYPNSAFCFSPWSGLNYSRSAIWVLPYLKLCNSWLDTQRTMTIATLSLCAPNS